MAKKAKPRWGYQKQGFALEQDGTFKQPAIFSDDQVSDLAGQIGVNDPARIAKLKGVLDDRADYYRIYKQHEEGPGRPEVCAALFELLSRACDLHDMLLKLDSETEKALMSAYSPDRFDYEEQFANGRIKLSRDIRHLRRLYSSIESAREATPKGIGGRIGISPLKWLALSMAEIYEAFSKDKFFLSEKYGVTPSSKFVSATLRIVEPDATDINLVTAMRHAVHELNKRR